MPPLTSEMGGIAGTTALDGAAEAGAFGPIAQSSAVKVPQIEIEGPGRVIATLQGTREAAPHLCWSIDYHALIARAVGGLSKNTAESRRALYLSAEATLVRELQTLDPPLPELEVIRERLSFHKAMHRVETEWTLRDVGSPPLKKLSGRPSDQPGSAPGVLAAKPESRSGESGTDETRSELPEDGSYDPPLGPMPWQLAKAIDPKRSASPVVRWTFIAVLIAGAFALTLYSQHEWMRTFLVQSRVIQSQGDITSLWSEIVDWAGRGSSWAQTPVAAVAQSAVLYEEDPIDAQGKRYIGSVIWKSETVSLAEGQTTELVVRASVEIPARRMNMTMCLRRNAEKALGTTHTIEIMFDTPTNSTFRGVSDVPSILVKQAERALGQRLAGVTVKQTSGSFIATLSAAEADARRNLNLMKEQSWFDIPIIYGSGQRAILAIEIGESGKVAFKQAFAAWAE